MPQEPRQATAATQPFPVGDAFVPKSIEIAPEGFRLVNGGSIFTPYWTDYVLVKPGLARRRELAAELVRPADTATSTCARATRGRVPGVGDHRGPSARRRSSTSAATSARNPMPLSRRLRGARPATNKIVWQQHWPERCYSGSIATAGGLVFVGRNDGRLTALDSANGANSGSSKPARA